MRPGRGLRGHRKASVHMPAQFEAPVQQAQSAPQPEAFDDAEAVVGAAFAARHGAQGATIAFVRRDPALVAADCGQRQP